MVINDHCLGSVIFNVMYYNVMFYNNVMYYIIKYGLDERLILE